MVPDWNHTLFEKSCVCWICSSVSE